MTRARQVANFDPALFATDEVSGDKVSGGTIGAGVIGASVTGGAGLTGSTSLGTVTAGNLSNVDIVQPAGSILQVGSDIYNSQVESNASGTTPINYLSVTLTARQANTKFYYNAGVVYGGEGDADDMHLFMTKTAGSSATETDYVPAANRAGGTQGQTNNRVVHVDYTNSANADDSQYLIAQWQISDTLASTHAIDAQITIGLWIAGGCFINRSKNRGNQETGITTLIVMEIGV